VVVDSTHVPWHTVQGINDMFTPICRGTIGKSRNELDLFCAYNVARADFWPPDSTPYFDIYLAFSTDGGATWHYHVKLTNLSGPLRDCRYPSLSPVNDLDFTYRIANLEYQNDSIPGSAVNGASESPAQQHFIRARIIRPDAVKKLGNEIPLNFALYQNYPNPFNPVTKIKFEIPLLRGVAAEGGRGVSVRLIIYDIIGREIAILVNEKLKPGTYEVEWDGSNFPSGVYFYKLQAGNYEESKKMILMK
jgi:hypothetical protein